MKLSFMAGAVVGNSLFFSENSLNGLFEMNIENGDTRLICLFPGEDARQRVLHKQAISYGDKLIFIPNKGSNVHVFDTKTYVVKAIPLYRVNSKLYVFGEGVIFKNLLYVMPGNLEQPVVEINLITFKTRTIDTGLDKILKDREPDDQIFCWAVLHEEKIYMSEFKGNRIVKYDISRELFSCEKIGIDDLYGIYDEGKDIILTTSHLGLYKWNDETGEIREIEKPKDKGNDINGYCLIVGKQICAAIPDMGGKILVYKGACGSSQLEKEVIIKRPDVCRRMGGLYEYGVAYDRKVIIFPTYNTNILITDGISVKEIKPVIANIDDFYEKCDLKGIFDRGVQREGELLELEDLLETVVNM